MDETTETKIEKYIASLKQQLNIELIVLFGSYLTGEFSKDSDIDILVVASEFSKISKLEAYKILSKPIWDIQLNIDPIPAAPEEIQNYQKASFLTEIMDSGKIVFPKSA
jgi:predicted nucleotidyltransferase